MSTKAEHARNIADKLYMRCGPGEHITEDFAKRFGAVLMPEILVQVGLIANHFKAPFGCAFIRCKEQGWIKFDQAGQAHWSKP